MPKKALRLRISCPEARYKKYLKIRNIMKFCTMILGAEGITGRECGIIFVDNKFIQDMNLSYFGKNVPTDVISFPLHTDSMSGIEGEMYISIEQAELQACEYHVPVNTELQRLIVHGILHIVGYDDATAAEKRKMTLLENRYIRNFGNLGVWARL